MDLKLCPNSKMDNVITKQFSRADTIGEFIIHIFNISQRLPEIKLERVPFSYCNRYVDTINDHRTIIGTPVLNV